MVEAVSEAPHRRLAYLPALDGVRAFAVVAVMIYHGGPFFAPGGFMGVDTFFVLSGFLITSLLVGEWRETLTIKLGNFWARRARRLLPALLLMLLFVAFFASVIVPKGTYPAPCGSTRWPPCSTSATGTSFWSTPTTSMRRQPPRRSSTPGRWPSKSSSI